VLQNKPVLSEVSGERQNLIT